MPHRVPNTRVTRRSGRTRVETVRVPVHDLPISSARSSVGNDGPSGVVNHRAETTGDGSGIRSRILASAWDITF
jgi:hypothetical protein